MSNLRQPVESVFTPNTLKLIRSILGDDYTNTELFQKALQQYATANYVVKAGVPRPLTDTEVHGPCC